MPTNKHDDGCYRESTLEHPASPQVEANVQLGLSTKVALSRLHDEIEKVLLECEGQYGAESCYRKLRAAFVKRYDSPLGWLSIGTTLLTSFALFITSYGIPSLCLLIILLLDLFMVIRENNLRRTEIYRKTRNVLTELQMAEQYLCEEWKPSNYPHLNNPMSPSVSLQWTYRDGVIVNLPWALLVRGDYIILRPGHISPGPCHEVETKKFFNTNEIYGASQMGDPPVKPVARAPLPDLICCLERTPYLDNLRICLRNSLKRPPTIYNQQRYLLVTKYIQQWGFISALIITVFAGLLRVHGYGLPTRNWVSVLVESPAAAVIPLLPLIFPLMWISMNLWGVARLQCFLKTPQAILEKTATKSFEEDLDTPSYDYDNISLLRSNVLRTWIDLWRGNCELLPRSANLVQVLGSISALCCVDKKGILSWPNPTAEKVFFLHNTDDEQNDDGARSNSQLSMETESEDGPDVDEDHKGRGIVAEVLDLTHDQHCPFRLEFDDHEWKAHIKSLKPLGLAILLNTCSPLTHEHYAQFCSHVTAVAMLDKDLVPVTNRYAIIESSMKSFLHGRCLCELAKQIGFTDHATDRFALEGQLASYRHLQPDVVRRDIRFARQLQLSSKVKVPFPHSLSVVMRENPGGYLSLFTQGTADIILDCCDDFWDGKDLRPLSPQDRKRALDFYQRSALTSYCTAFAYRPLRHGIHGALSGPNPQHNGGPIAYLELPPESKLRMQHVDKRHCDFEGGHHVKLSHSISTDSLLFSESKDEDCNDVEGCFEMQCHQVFIGMVTMQYQAQNDIVRLVERLERACIRFVHFSKENELRSRVFSEKMGLESGWNCHISLLSEPEETKTNSIATAKGKDTTSDGIKSPKCPGKQQQQQPNTTSTINTATACTTTTITTTITDTNDHLDNTSNIHNSSAKIMNIQPLEVKAGDQPTDHDHIDFVGDEAGGAGDGPDLNYLLGPPNNLESSKTLSSSAPGAISNPDECSALNETPSSGESNGIDSDEVDKNDTARDENGEIKIPAEPDPDRHKQRHSLDSAMDENCRSMSTLTESTDQSAPINFDMSNRAKLPRGIENIRPHLEQVDNVPLQVSLFTDCSAEATRQMLDIMQSYGEIVVCLGSSANSSNAEIFLQADCSIAVEPLHPQVCQDVAAFTEKNIHNNKVHLQRRMQQSDKIPPTAAPPDDTWASQELLESGLFSSDARAMQSPAHTISPIYLSRLLNSLPCSIAVCRDDPLSLVAIIELSRRFSLGLWNCIQYWACCAGAISILNVLCACLTLPPLLTPLVVIYLMCVPVPLIAISLAHIDVDPKIMNRATSKKQTDYDSRAFAFVLWCYGCKFLLPVLILLVAYWMFIPQSFSDQILGEKIETNGLCAPDNSKLYKFIDIARSCSLLGLLLHFVLVSITFVHRDHSLWQRNPFRNRIWALTCLGILLIHLCICLFDLMPESVFKHLSEVYIAIIIVFGGSLLSLAGCELAKYQENKVNARYQRRARLDFGTKLGMNSPF